MPNALLRVVDEDRLNDLESIADYFLMYGWDDYWPGRIILSLARLGFPGRAPFTLDTSAYINAEPPFTEEELRNEMFYFTDVRDKDGVPLVVKPMLRRRYDLPK